MCCMCFEAAVCLKGKAQVMCPGDPRLHGSDELSLPWQMSQGTPRVPELRFWATLILRLFLRTSSLSVASAAGGGGMSSAPFLLPPL